MSTLFRADLHIHSRYSRATSKKLTPRNLAAWAALKGIGVLGSGDLTHAKWRDELRAATVFDEASGLYRMMDTQGLQAELPEAMQHLAPDASPLFMLQGEVSSIYKRGGKVRKVHNLVFMPDFDAAERFSQRLSRIGNLESDGRPILGLDSRDLLEIVLETAPGAFLIPAHIWTPWFALFGSKSGFNSMEECFGDLAHEIFALETGLSSDPDMNRLWSALDPYKLVSNSDAHSGDKLGREANLFSGIPSYMGIYHALKDTAPDCRFEGTLEFFPEEGKYHLDGHRACNVVLDPHESKSLDGICPVCGKPLTLGVLYRVEELADRQAPVFSQDEQFLSLIPLTELCGEILGVGPQSKKVAAMYAEALAKFGSELDILQTIPTSDLDRFNTPLGEAVKRMRAGSVIRKGGYDGEFGTIRVFTPEEQRDLRYGSLFVGGLLQDAPQAPKQQKSKKKAPDPSADALLRIMKEPPVTTLEGPSRKRSSSASSSSNTPASPADEEEPAPPATRINHPQGQPLTPPQSIKVTVSPYPQTVPTASQPGTSSPKAYGKTLLNATQQQAVSADQSPVLVLAGPGSGKTRTLIERIHHLLQSGIPANQILALTFTKRAAAEMQERLYSSLGDRSPVPQADTLHALAYSLWQSSTQGSPILLDERTAKRVFDRANNDLTAATLQKAWLALNLSREQRIAPDPELAQLLASYTKEKQQLGLADYTDLLEYLLERLQQEPQLRSWQAVLVDEVQDLSTLQLEVVKALLPPSGHGFFGIGDPDQSIYGFRGAHGQVQDFFLIAWPTMQTIALSHNYRSAPALVHSASCLMAGYSRCKALQPGTDKPGQILCFEAPSAASEAAWVAGKVRMLLGQSSHTLQDTAKRGSLELLQAGELSPGDIAVLVRLRSLIPTLQKTLLQYGITAAVPEETAFWHDERIAVILDQAALQLGLGNQGKSDTPLLPTNLLMLDPKALATPPVIIAPFDSLFWQTPAFNSLCKAYEKYGGWPGLLSWIHMQNEEELVRARAEQVQIMTLHAAKGLEFKAVFMPCLEEGLMPFAGNAMLSGSAKADMIPPDAAEERRLFYVGLTRAKQSLFLSYSKKRRLYGQEISLPKSSFLRDLPQENLLHFALVEKKKQKAEQLSLL